MEICNSRKEREESVWEELLIFKLVTGKCFFFVSSYHFKPNEWNCCMFKFVLWISPDWTQFNAKSRSPFQYVYDSLMLYTQNLLCHDQNPLFKLFNSYNNLRYFEQNLLTLIISIVKPVLVYDASYHTWANFFYY